MWIVLSALLASFAVTLLVVRSAKGLERLAGDHDLSGPQKFHARPVPRIGGVGIFVGVAIGVLVMAWFDRAALPVGTTIIDARSWGRAASGSVTAMTIAKAAPSAPLVNHFRPSIT